jgi:acyl-CoA thioester hydrolase
MISFDTKVRVRYGETDKMGFVYYGIYPLYYEIGRIELIRSFGLTYSYLEENGILMPVYSCNLRYIKAAIYDELLTIRTMLKELPGVRIKFDYEIFNENVELINTGDAVLLFIDNQKRKPRKAPEILLELLRPHFEN